ncbi:Transcription factor iws1, partial [Gnomoniopsis sp. IMI 355080]
MSDIEENEHNSAPPTPIDSPAAAANDDDNDDANNSDRDSDQLSEVDVDDLEDYDPLKANIETRPVEIDEDVAKSLKATKRKRAGGDAAVSKKPKEGRRQKKRRTGGDGDDEVSAADGTIIEGKRRRGGGGDDGEGGGGEKRSKARASAKASPAPEVEENLTPEQRRARAIEKAMDAAMKAKKSTRRSKKDDIDLEEELDELIADVKTRMEKACENDNEAVTNGLPAVQKVKMLPEVMTLLNRQNIQHAVLDPETNFLCSVKFFLEPLSNDGQLPAYNIQREIFTALTKMQIEKEALLSSGIGRIVLFYTKTKRAQPEIKRMAERLMGEWSRPILKRTDDYKKRLIDSRVVDT